MGIQCHGLASPSAIEPGASWFGDVHFPAPCVVRIVVSMEGRWSVTSFVADGNELLLQSPAGGIPLEAFNAALQVAPRLLVRRRLVVALANLDDAPRAFAGAVGTTPVAPTLALSELAYQLVHQAAERFAPDPDDLAAWRAAAQRADDPEKFWVVSGDDLEAEEAKQKKD